MRYDTAVDIVFSIKGTLTQAESTTPQTPTTPLPVIQDKTGNINIKISSITCS